MPIVHYAYPNHYHNNLLKISIHQVSGSNMYNDNENIAKYEIMDGAPVRSERKEEISVFKWKIFSWNFGVNSENYSLHTV